MDAFGRSVAQELPQDSSLTIKCDEVGNRTLVFTSQLNDWTTTTPKNKRSRDIKFTEDDQTTTTRFWADYWQSVPQITLPDPALQEIVDYGLYKQACVTPPQGVAATLQGPFMEDYQVVPWSNDYHFNINVQMMYTPALATNRLSHFGPLWTMMQGWLPTLRQNGESFFGKPGQPAKGALHAAPCRGRPLPRGWYVLDRHHRPCLHRLDVHDGLAIPPLRPRPTRR